MNEPVEERKIEMADDLPHNADWAEQLMAYVDNELDVVATQQVAIHVAACVSCRAEVKTTRLLKAQLAGLPELAVPRSFALTPAHARRLNPRPLYTAVRVALAVAATLLIFVCGLDFLGLATQTTHTTIAVKPVATVTPDYSLPPIGTRPACGVVSGQGNVICSNSESGTNVPTATPRPPTQFAIITTEASPTVRIAEIALVALVLALAAFALVVRPRAPTKLQF